MKEQAIEKEEKEKQNDWKRKLQRKKKVWQFLPDPDVLSICPCEMIALCFRRVKSDWTSMAGRGGIYFRLQESLVLNPPKPHPQALLLFLQSNQWLITEGGRAGTECVASARKQTTHTHYRKHTGPTSRWRRDVGVVFGRLLKRTTGSKVGSDTRNRKSARCQRPFSC